jgi:hypothetical protein
MQQVASSDSRILARLSEDLAVGIAHWLLYKHYGVAYIADAGPFLDGAIGSGQYTGKTLRSLSLYGVNGGYKPDYFGLTAAQEAVIAECKGSVGAPGQLTGPLKKGKQQVSNVDPVGCSLRSTANRLVFATSIPIVGKQRNSTNPTTVIQDPTEEHPPIKVKVTPDQILRQAYHQVFQTLGMDEVGEALVRQEAGNLFRYIDSEPLSDSDHDCVLLGGAFEGWRFAFTARVWEALLQSDEVPLSESLRRYETPFVSDEHAVFLPNGFGITRERRYRTPIAAGRLR